MFKVPLKEIERKFNIPYRTIQNFNEAEGYRKEVVNIFSDLIILEELAKKDIEKFKEAEIPYITEGIDNYLTEILLNKTEALNQALTELIKDNNKIKELTENAMLQDFLEPEEIKATQYRIDKYLDKLSRYFLVKDLFEETYNYLKSVKKEGKHVLKD
jgi:hypothetical protein